MGGGGLLSRCRVAMDTQWAEENQYMMHLWYYTETEGAFIVEFIIMKDEEEGLCKQNGGRI